MSTPNSQTRQGQPGDPCIMVICGAGGDLTKRKLIPALCNLAKAGLLSKQFAIVGFSRGGRGPPRSSARSSPPTSGFATPVEPELGPGLPRIYSVGGVQGLHRPTRPCGPAGAWKGAQHARKLPLLSGHGARVLRRDRAPARRRGLTREDNGRWRRVIIEKPFGHDLESARALNAELRKRPRGAADLSHRPLPGQGDGAEHPGVPLRQRHLRADLEPALHRPRADHRGRDGRRRAARRLLRTAGALRDMVPNHLFQLISLTAMEPPISFESRCGARRAGQGAARHPAAHAGRGADRDGARPVRRGDHRR